MSDGYTPGGSGGGGGGTGPSGPPGQGVPPGGTAAQALTKVDATNYNTAWTTVAGGTPGPNSIDNTMLADSPASTIKGKLGGPAGDPQDLTPAQARNVLANDSGGGTTLFLRADATWAAPAGGGGGGNLSLNITNTPKSGSVSAAANEFVLFDTSAGAGTLVLPAAPANGTLVGGRIVTFGAGNFVTVNCSGSDVFFKAGGVTTSANVLQVNNSSVLYEYQAGIWQLLATGITIAALDARYGTDTLAAGSDLVLTGPTGGVVTLDVAATQHNLWTPLSGFSATDTTINNNGAYQDEAAYAIAVAANASYMMQGYILYDASVASDFRVNFSTPAGATGNYKATALNSGWTSGAPALSPGQYQPAVNWTTSQSLGAQGVGTQCHAQLDGVLVTSTAGTLQFRWCQFTADPTPCIRKAFTTIMLRRFA